MMRDVFADAQIDQGTAKALMDGGSELAATKDMGAIHLFKLAILWFERAGDVDGQIQALMYCFGVSMDCGQPTQAGDFLRRAEMLISQSQRKDVVESVMDAIEEIGDRETMSVVG